VRFILSVGLVEASFSECGLISERGSVYLYIYLSFYVLGNSFRLDIIRIFI
jgi:hypothetical protein